MAILTALMQSRGCPSSGTVAPFAGSSAPSGWLLCNGSAVSRATYKNLFAAIGITFGAGDGSTTFNLPNGQGVFLRSAGSQTVSSKTFNGGSIAAKSGHSTAINGLTASTTCTPTTTVNQTSLAHTHSLNDSYGSTGSISPAGDPGSDHFAGTNITANQSDNTGSALTTHTHTATYGVTHATTPSSSDTETAPAAMSLNFIIKT